MQYLVNNPPLNHTRLMSNFLFLFNFRNGRHGYTIIWAFTIKFLNPRLLSILSTYFSITYLMDPVYWYPQIVIMELSFKSEMFIWYQGTRQGQVIWQNHLMCFLNLNYWCMEYVHQSRKIFTLSSPCKVLY